MTVSPLEQLLGDKLLRDEPLAKYTAARIGGPAEYLYIANETIEALADVVQIAWNVDSPVRVLGGGANVLVSDQGLRGLVIVNRVKQTTFDGRCVKVTGGVSLTNLANQCAKHGLAGFEWAISVPGTVGGAVVNNAGAHGGDINDSLVWADIVDAMNGRQRLTLAEMAYDYRTSALKSRSDRRFLVLEAQLQFEQDDSDTIRARMDKFRAHRKRTQPPGASLGSIFKNPDGDYAGRLIEAAGLKGYTIGNAAVSDVHANFFINTGNATATDYDALIRHVQATVESQFGVLLEPEIERIGEGF